MLPIGYWKRTEITAIPVVDAGIEQDFTGALRKQLITATVRFLNANAHHVGERELQFGQGQTAGQSILARQIRLLKTVATPLILVFNEERSYIWVRR